MGKKDKDTIKKLSSRSENLTDWLNEVLMRADILDYRYNLKGCGVWKAYGFKLRKHVMKIIRDLLENTPIPHDEYLFPLLVPEPQFMKEAVHVKGFEDEVYWVTHGGKTELDVKLALRPTSETAMYPMFALWIKSHQDLPLKTYQIVNCFRWEGKNTRPLIRVREITTFKEGHTVHASAEDAEAQIVEAIQAYKDFFDALGLSYVINDRPKWDIFPGADYSIAVDVIFPGRHRALQIGTIHNLGQTFAKTFDIKFENVNGETEFGFQTCFGISERCIAALIALHGDDKGAIIPAHIAPIQIAIVPILFKDSSEVVLKYAHKIEKILKNEGFRVTFDSRKIKPGPKFFHWEQKGVPLRLEVGPRDVENKQVILVRRDSNEKIKSSIVKKELIANIQDIFKSIEENQKERIAQHTKDSLLRTDDLNEATEFVEKDKGLVEIPFCGSEDCAADIEKRVDGLKFLGTPARYLKFLNHDLKSGEINAKFPEKKEIFCINCSEKVDKYWTIGRSY